MRRAFLIRIDVSSKTPVYEQIAAEIRALLVEGELLPGAPLPTVRQLALDLNVHHNTVANAYRILADEGWLELRRRRGARVIPRCKPGRSNRHKFEMFRRELKRLLGEAAAAGIPPRSIVNHLTSCKRYVMSWAPIEGNSR